MQCNRLESIEIGNIHNKDKLTMYKSFKYFSIEIYIVNEDQLS